MAGIAPAWAVDVDGAPVPARFEVSGTPLTLVESAPNTTYPVIADPWLGQSLISSTSTFSRPGHLGSRRADDVGSYLVGDLGRRGQGIRHQRNLERVQDPRGRSLSDAGHAVAAGASRVQRSNQEFLEPRHFHPSRVERSVCRQRLQLRGTIS